MSVHILLRFLVVTRLTQSTIVFSSFLTFSAMISATWASWILLIIFNARRMVRDSARPIFAHVQELELYILMTIVPTPGAMKLFSITVSANRDASSSYKVFIEMLPFCKAALVTYVQVSPIMMYPARTPQPLLMLQLDLMSVYSLASDYNMVPT